MSFISAGTVELIEDQLLRLWETERTLQGGGVELILARENPESGEYANRPAQTVTVTYGQSPFSSRGETASTVAIDGFFERPAPFDVEIGDLFTLVANEGYLPGRITLVLPAEMGMQRAAFQLTMGEAR